MLPNPGSAKVLPILVIIAITGLISFLLISMVGPFTSRLFNPLFPKISSHAAGDGTTVNSLSLASTYESISVYASFSGDFNSNNQASLKWRKSGTSTWIQGMDMTVDRRTTIVHDSSVYQNPYINQWRASVIGLTKNTSYDIQVTFSDPDGISGTNPITQTITTRDDTYPSPGKTYYVIPTGSDSNPGSQTSPFQTIQHAVDTAAAGDTVLVEAGTYHEMVTVKLKSGLDSQHFLTIKNFGTDRPIIDGINNPSVCGAGYGGAVSCGILIKSRYTKVSGFEITNVSNGIKFQLPNTNELPPGSTDTSIHDVVIGNNLIHNLNFVSIPAVGILIGTSSSESPIYNITIQNNELHAAPADPNAGAITFMASQGGHVVRGNKIYFSHQGTAGVHGSDCITGLPNVTLSGGQSKDTDIYNNYCEGATDDAYSIDGGGMNERVWNNVAYKSNTGISIAPVMLGPTYVFRNVFHDLAYHWTTCLVVKEGENGTGFVYFYHNTFENSDANNLCTSTDTTQSRRAIDVEDAGSSTASANLVFKNNILHGYDESLAIESQANLATLKWDYDLHNNAITLNNRILKYGGINYSTLSGFQTNTGQETHGLYAAPSYVAAASADFHLQTGSFGIDQGTVLTGFNDPTSQWPFQGSGPDIGAFESATSNPSPSPAPSGCPKASIGDVNCNGTIDLLDYSTLVANFAKTVAIGTLGDLNKNGTIDLLDYSTLIANFGK